jgi:hypothetical protein
VCMRTLQGTRIGKLFLFHLNSTSPKLIIATILYRGHTVKSVTESFHMAKDAGYKIVAHMMPDLVSCEPDLPSSLLRTLKLIDLIVSFSAECRSRTRYRSVQGSFRPGNFPLSSSPASGLIRSFPFHRFQEFFENPAYRSDGLKLYPTLVIRGTGLYELWKTHKYKNYTPNALVDIVARIMALVPPWTRVYRVQRDIPMPLVSSGVENGNLRELALGRMKDFGAECRDVRFREVGVSWTNRSPSFPTGRQILIVTTVVPVHRFTRSTTRSSPTTSSLSDVITLPTVRPPSFCLWILRSTPPTLTRLHLHLLVGGWETFLSYEDAEQDVLVGLLRLRKCSEEGTFRKELVNGPEGMGASMVRELVSPRSIPRCFRFGLTPFDFSSTCTERPSRFTVAIRRSSSIRSVSSLCSFSLSVNADRFAAYQSGYWNAAHGGSRADRPRGARQLEDRRHRRNRDEGLLQATR